MTTTEKAGMACGSYRAPFGDGLYVFRLDVDGLRELQEKTDAGPAYLLRRIAVGEWRVDDLRETLRIGLVRGGLDPVRALVLIARYFDDAPKGRHVGLASLILSAAIFEPEELKTPGKDRPKRKRRTSAADSASATLSDQAPPSDSLPPKPEE